MSVTFDPRHYVHAEWEQLKDLTYEQRNQVETVRASLDLAALVEELRATAVTHIMGTHYGSGDEGGVQEFLCYAGELAVEDPEMERDLHQIVDFAVTQSVGGPYWDGDGGGGSFHLDVAKGELTVKHYWHQEESIAEPTMVMKTDGTVEQRLSDTERLVSTMTPFELRQEAQAIIGEDRVSEDALRKFILTYARENE